MAKKKAVKEMDADTRATFDKMQKKIDEPECFGKYNPISDSNPDGNDQCWQCWYHPDCKKK